MIDEIKQSSFQTTLLYSDNAKDVADALTKDDKWEAFHFEFLEIVDVRKLASFFSTKLGGINYVVSFKKIKLEAQNIFLKLLEELDSNSRIVLMVPVGYKIIPTILSRINNIVHEVSVSEEGEDQDLNTVKKIEEKLNQLTVSSKRSNFNNLKRLHRLARNNVVPKKNIDSLLKVIT